MGQKTMHGVAPQVVVARGNQIIIKDVSQRKIPLDMKLSILADVLTGLTQKAVAARFGVGVSTVRDIQYDPELNAILNPELVKRRKDVMSQVFAYKSLAAQNHVTEAKLEASSALQLTTISAINFDKHRLAEGLSTENVAVKTLVGDLNDQHKRLKEREIQLAKELGIGGY